MFGSRWAVTTVACVAVAALISSCGSSDSSVGAGQGAIDTNATLSVGWTRR